MIEAPPFAPQEIHVWYANLNPPAGIVDTLRPLLSPDEQKRMARFKFEKHRRRYAVRRGQLRRLLGAYLGAPPEAVEIAYGERGKPHLAAEAGKPEDERLEFNLSDSEDLTVYSFAKGAEIGVDVEILREMEDAVQISESFFAKREREILASMPPEQVSETFFNCWTRKEAYLKAIGEGLAEPLDSFCVTLRPDEEPRFVEFVKVPHELDLWTLFHFRPTADSIAALALRRRGWSVTECGWV